MPNQIGFIPTPLLRQILREWSARKFNWTDEEADMVVDATRDQIYKDARDGIHIKYKDFLTRVATQSDLNGTDLALDAKKRLEELEQVLEGEQ